jgi:transposase
LANKGYDGEYLRHQCDRYPMQLVIQLPAMLRKLRLGALRFFDRPKYRQRGIIERLFSWLKENRRAWTCYDELVLRFAAIF